MTTTHRPTLAQFLCGRFVIRTNYCPATGFLLTKVNFADHATRCPGAGSRREAAGAAAREMRMSPGAAKSILLTRAPGGASLADVVEPRGQGSWFSPVTRVVAGLAIATAAVGCMRYTIPYQSQMPRLQAAGGGHSIALAVQDGRRDVAFGVKAPQFCGFQRNGYGIPHPIYTESGQPLATELAQAVAHGLQTKGFRVFIVAAVPGPPDPAIMQALAYAQTDRSLFIHFSEWYSDTMNNTGLKYQALADVRDDQGRPLAASQVAGNDNLGGNFFDPSGHMADAVPAAAQTILERLLNDPAITRALQVDAPVP
jgi:hypothetical protein